MKPILKLVNEEGKTVIFVTHRISAIKDGFAIQKPAT